ncbi:dTDP-glucose 4,6-dehydratase [subsurface metagenome]
MTKDTQVVVHMAAMVGVQEVLSNALYTLDVNYVGTSNLLKAVARASNCERVVFFSTSEIFGSGAFGIAENGNTVLSSVQDVRWCYCISKLAAEHLALSYYRQEKLPVVVVRPFNIFGPGRVGDHVVIRFILKALKNEDLEVYGDGTQIRAWCYIDDFCDALLKCMEVKEAVGQSFNIGNPRNTCTIYELAKKIVSLCGSKSKIVFKALDFTDIDLRVPNTAKARDMLGFVPKFDLEEGLSGTIEWVKRNEDELRARISAKKREYIV